MVRTTQNYHFHYYFAHQCFVHVSEPSFWFINITKVKTQNTFSRFPLFSFPSRRYFWGAGKRRKGDWINWMNTTRMLVRKWEREEVSKQVYIKNCRVININCVFFSVHCNLQPISCLHVSLQDIIKVRKKVQVVSYYS